MQAVTKLYCPAVRPPYFSTRKLLKTSASMPELKKVRTASVGVLTIALLHRLKEVFIITGMPVSELRVGRVCQDAKLRNRIERQLNH